MFLALEAQAEEVQRRTCEVGCQWERPEDERREVGCQSDSTGHSDAAVQVDLLGLSCRKTGSCDVPWRCVSVRADEPGGGALWQHCSSQQDSAMFYSPPTLSTVLLCSSPTRADPQDSDCTPLFQDDQAELSLPSMPLCDLSLPSMPLCDLSLPSMPLCDLPSCGESPTALLRQSPDFLEEMGFIAPLSSDEEELSKPHQDEFFPEDRPPVKRRRGRPPVHGLKRRDFIKNSKKRVVQSSSDAETKTKRCRRRRTAQIKPSKGKEHPRPRRNTVGLPVRYQGDYDMNLDENEQRLKRKIYMVGQDVKTGENCKQTDKTQIQKFVCLQQSVLHDLSKRSVKVGRFEKHESPSKEPNVGKRLDINGLEDIEQPNQPIKTPLEIEKFNIYHIKPRPLPLYRTVLQKNKKPLLKEKVKLNVDKYPLNETNESPKEAKKQKLKNLQQTYGKSPTKVSKQKLKSEERISGDPHKMASKEGLDWLIFENIEKNEKTCENPHLTFSEKASDRSNLQNKTIKQETQEMQSSLALIGCSKLLKTKNQTLVDSNPHLKASKGASDCLNLQNKTIEQEQQKETQSMLALKLQNETIKQDKMEETVAKQCTSTASSELLKAKKKLLLQAKKIASKETSDCSIAGNQMLQPGMKEGGISGKCRELQNPTGNEKEAPLNIVEVDEAIGQLTQVTMENRELVKQWHNGVQRRRPGRPKKNSQKQNKPNDFKIQSKTFCTKQIERPRRTMVGPPIRYLLESEDLLEKSYQQLCPDEQKTVRKGRRGRPRKIQTVNTEVGGASEMIGTVKEDGDDSKWPIKEEETEMSLENEVLKDNSLGGACKMLVLGPDRKWTKQKAPKPKLKSQGKLKERLSGQNKSANQQTENPELDLRPKFPVKMRARSDSEDSDGDCEAFYEFENIEQFNYVVCPEEIKTERDVGGACEMIALLEHVGDQNRQRELANQNAADKTQLGIVNGEDLKVGSVFVGGASQMNDRWESVEQERTVVRKPKRKRLWWKKPRGEADDWGGLKKGAKDIILMHQDLDTGQSTIIPPCVVKLQQHT